MSKRKIDVEKFRTQLEELRGRINRILGKVSEEVKSKEESKGYSQHQADEGTDDFGQTISLEIPGKEQSILKQIERSLAKIDEGTYGICDVSGEEIPLKRLEAVPYANMTVQAQERYEKGLL
ncbi:MAG: TraR/DksA family transcriptional regulator [Simkaniaceae bacterium]|nr:TraR/DksA family transcriptional regulator [Simkaniaceae bacterium]